MFSLSINKKGNITCSLSENRKNRDNLLNRVEKPLKSQKQTELNNSLKDDIKKTTLEFCQTFEYYLCQENPEDNLTKLFDFYRPILGIQKCNELIEEIQKKLLSLNRKPLLASLEKFKASEVPSNEISANTWLHFFKILLKLALLIAFVVFVGLLLAPVVIPKQNINSQSSIEFSPALKASDSTQLVNSQTNFFQQTSHLSFFEQMRDQKAQSKNRVRKYSTLLNTCPIITKEFIKKFIVGQHSNETIEKITKAILEAQRIHPVIANYISIVFNYLPGFKIQPKFYPPNQKMDELGVYNNLRILSLCYNCPYPILVGTVIHEFRHAIMNTIHTNKAASGVSFSHECFSPITREEEAKFKTSLESGDKRVEKIKNLLDLEAKDQLTENQRQYLRMLRQMVEKIYVNSHYGIILSNTEYKSIKNIPSEKSLVGKEIFSPIFGKVKCIEYIEVNREVRLLIKVLDPLKALIIQIASSRDSSYLPEQYLYEREAALYEKIPIPFIEKFYPDLHNNGEKLIKESIFPGHAKPLNLNENDPESFNPSDLILACQNEDQFINSINLERFSFYSIHFFEKKTDLENVEKCVDVLIKNSYDLQLAYRLKAELLYNNNKFKDASRYYAGVYSSFDKIDSSYIKSDAEFLRTPTHLHYAVTLKKIGEHQKSKQLAEKILICYQDIAAYFTDEDKALLQELTGKKINLDYRNPSLGR